MGCKKCDSKQAIGAIRIAKCLKFDIEAIQLMKRLISANDFRANQFGKVQVSLIRAKKFEIVQVLS